MGALASKFSSEIQEWSTPPSLFDPLDQEFSFTLDAAAATENAKVSAFFTRQQNGLAMDFGRATVWINPPFGDRTFPLASWVRKARDAAALGATVVILLPARTNTNWFHDICLRFAEIRFVRGRPRFNGSDHGLPQPLFISVFRPRG
jgi:site-specific DNA-methyltransferase (adenine-specific)